MQSLILHLCRSVVCIFTYLLPFVSPHFLFVSFFLLAEMESTKHQLAALGVLREKIAATKPVAADHQDQVEEKGLIAELESTGEIAGGIKDNIEK